MLVTRFGIGMGSPSHLLQQGAIVMRPRHASAPSLKQQSEKRCEKSCGVKHMRKVSIVELLSNKIYAISARTNYQVDFCLDACIEQSRATELHSVLLNSSEFLYYYYYTYSTQLYPHCKFVCSAGDCDEKTHDRSTPCALI